MLIDSAHTLFEKYHDDPEQPTSTARAVAPPVVPYHKGHCCFQVSVGEADDQGCCEGRRMTPGLLVDFSPGIVGVVFMHAVRSEIGIFTQIFFIDFSLATHRKSHDARRAIIRRERHQRESADHVTVNHVVVSATRRSCTLAGEYLEVVSFIGIARLLPLR